MYLLEQQEALQHVTKKQIPSYQIKGQKERVCRSDLKTSKFLNQVNSLQNFRVFTFLMITKERKARRWFVWQSDIVTNCENTGLVDRLGFAALISTLKLFSSSSNVRQNFLFIVAPFFITFTTRPVEGSFILRTVQKLVTCYQTDELPLLLFPHASTAYRICSSDEFLTHKFLSVLFPTHFSYFDCGGTF